MHFDTFYIVQLVKNPPAMQETWVRFLGGAWPSLVAQLVKNPPTMRETWVQSLDWEDPLEKGKAAHSSIWPGEFHGLYSPWCRKESDMTE